MQTIIFTPVLLAITAIGAYLQNPATPYIANTVVIGLIISVALNVIKPSKYGFYLYVIALVMLWQNTMLGESVVGSDIHRELFSSNRALTYGWDIQYWQEQSNVSFIVGWFIPRLNVITSIPTVWI